MTNYSITLNFFIPKTIVKMLNEFEVSGNLSFDWRKTEYCHCTVKAISICNEIPKKEIISNWVTESQKVLVSQKPFKVKVQDISNFPTTIFSHIQSYELIKLHKKLFKVLPSSQLQFKNNNYVPHVSLGIFNQEENGRTTKGFFPTNKKQNFGAFRVDEIQLLIWNLIKLDNPQIYHRFKLTK